MQFSFLYCLVGLFTILSALSNTRGPPKVSSTDSFISKCHILRNSVINCQKPLGMWQQVHRQRPCKLGQVYLIALLITLSADIETNPGPSGDFPCGTCMDHLVPRRCDVWWLWNLVSYIVPKYWSRYTSSPSQSPQLFMDMHQMWVNQLKWYY